MSSDDEAGYNAFLDAMALEGETMTDEELYGLDDELAVQESWVVFHALDAELAMQQSWAMFLHERRQGEP